MYSYNTRLKSTFHQSHMRIAIPSLSEAPWQNRIRSEDYLQQPRVVDQSQPEEVGPRRLKALDKMFCNLFFLFIRARELLSLSTLTSTLECTKKLQDRTKREEASARRRCMMELRSDQGDVMGDDMRVTRRLQKGLGLATAEFPRCRIRDQAGAQEMAVVPVPTACHCTLHRACRCRTYPLGL